MWLRSAVQSVFLGNFYHSYVVLIYTHCDHMTLAKLILVVHLAKSIGPFLLSQPILMSLTPPRPWPGSMLVAQCHSRQSLEFLEGRSVSAFWRHVQKTPSFPHEQRLLLHGRSGGLIDVVDVVRRPSRRCSGADDSSCHFVLFGSYGSWNAVGPARRIGPLCSPK